MADKVVKEAQIKLTVSDLTAAVLDQFKQRVLKMKAEVSKPTDLGAGLSSFGGGATYSGGYSPTPTPGTRSPRQPPGRAGTMLQAIASQQSFQAASAALDSWNDSQLRRARGELVDPKDVAGDIMGGIPLFGTAAQAGWKAGSSIREMITGEQGKGIMEAARTNRQAEIQDRKTELMRAAQNSRREAEFANEQRGRSASEMKAYATAHERERFEREDVVAYAQANGGKESEDIKRRRAAMAQQQAIDNEEINSEAEQSAKQSAANIEAIKFQSMDRSADAAVVMAKRESERAAEERRIALLKSGGVETQLVKEAAQKEAQAREAESAASIVAGRESRFFQEDNIRSIAQLKADYSARELARTGQTYAADLVLTKQFYDERLHMIKRAADEEMRQRPELSGAIQNKAKLEADRALQERNKQLKASAESEYGRREQMEHRLIGLKQQSLSFEVRAGRMGAAMDLERMKVTQEYTRRREELNQIIRSESATNEEKSIAQRMLGALPAESERAYKLAGYRGPTSGLAGGGHSEYGSGIAARATERAQNGMDRLIQEQKETRGTLEAIRQLLANNSRPLGTIGGSY